MPQEYRIDELARLAGTTVRNVRAYQDRGLLPPPRREGRVALYSGAHLARLKVIGTLLERGYTLANIAELMGAWERGQDIGALLGLEAALGSPWSDERPTTVEVAALLERLGNPDPALAARGIEVARRLGILAPGAESFDGPADEDGTVRVESPGMVEAATVLVEAGVPLAAVLDLVERMARDIDDVARGFVDLADTHVFEDAGEPPAPEDVPRLAELLERIRPLAKRSVDAALSRAMDREIQARYGERMARVLEAMEPDVAVPGAPGAGTVAGAG